MKDALVASAHGSGGSVRCGGSGSPTVSACPQLADPRRAAGTSPRRWPWLLDVAWGGRWHPDTEGAEEDTATSSVVSPLRHPGQVR